ncbi:hypothetical protein HDF26_004032 [Pedobacter cryoconitis]|uniref:SusD-like starch-binding protein associating with outer membrane n=1 Tax=Pedobacter cryoconitis TaxID=188932 RepID=A0A7W8ZKK3_9SPHI|nr:SusD/RagB family nutrient-binding outer membrane lipoprotein [Pedobacter cryoconitis]MBB5635565.1 hypothetical protein [Pedobacter cryoconitis]MBB6273572.1 hypothetical protein [Pedobacter cryoconitis]
MKKTNFKYNTLIFSAILLLSFGCKKTLDVNTDPNNPLVENATPEVLFPSAVMSTTAVVGGQLAIVGGIWSQYFTQAQASNQYKNIDSYNLTKNDVSVTVPYTEMFSGALMDYDLTLKKSIERSDWKYNLMATVMKAYSFQVLVDLYDKVPYTEAFQGAANLQPKFDNGDAIYTALLAEIDAALAKDFLGGTALTATQKNTDFVFHGDMNLWKQFANTLKLKMYLRMINANPTAAQAGINKLFQENAVFLSTDAGIKTWSGTPNNSNPFYEYNIRRLNTSTNLRASVTFVSWLTQKNDPRIVNYFGTDPIIPMHQGDFAATSAQQPTYGDATVLVQSAKDPVWFITKAESYFLQAEALERYAAGAGAKDAYDKGLQAAFDQAGQTLSGDLAATYAYPATGSLENKIEAIITQKWASFTGTHDIEAFFEQQRTGYPKFSPVYSTNAAYIPGQLVLTPNSVTAGLFPRRLVFPAAATDRNKNTPAVVPITTKVWWGK